MKRIVLLRHGESLWNQENRFTGWTDVDLSEKGVVEACIEGAQKTWKAIQEFSKTGGRGIYTDTYTKHKCGQVFSGDSLVMDNGRNRSIIACRRCAVCQEKEGKTKKCGSGIIFCAHVTTCRKRTG